MYYFYMVRCSDNSLYCGSTNNLEKRVEEHNHDPKKGAKYTRSRRPVKLVYSETFSDKSEALKREAEIKSWPKARKENLINLGNLSR